MKTLRRFRTSLGGFMTVLMAVWQITQPMQNLTAATFYWDNDATAAGNTVGDAGAGAAGLGNAGTWDTTTAKFWAPFAGADSIWDNTTNINDTVVIQGGTAGSITLGTAVSAGSLVFNTTGYTVTGSTLTLSGAGATAGEISFGPNIAAATVSSIIAGGNGLTLNGNGSDILTLGAANTVTGLLTLNSGGITMTGSFTSANDVKLGGTSTFRQQQAAGGTQALGALTFAGGDGGFTTVKGTGNTFTTFTSLAAHAEGAVGLFVNNATVIGAQTGAQTIAGQAAGQMGAGYFFSASSTGPYAYAVYDTTQTINTVRGLSYGTDANSATQAGGVTITVTGASQYAQTTGALTAQANATLATLNIVGANNVTQAAGSTLTLQGILKTSGTASVIAGAAGTASITAGGGGELILRSDVAADSITLNTPISSSTGALTKSGIGPLTLAPNTFSTGVVAGNPSVNVANGALFSVGETVSGVGIPAATTIASIAGNVLTLSAAPTMTNATAFLTYGGVSNAYTGTTYVNGGTLNAVGSSSLGAGAIKLNGGLTQTAASATNLSLQSDGDGLGTRQTVGGFGQNVTVVGNSTITVGKITAAQALNKTIQLGSLSLGEDTLNVVANNGYGLQFTGNTSITAATGATYFNVGTANASSVVQSLTLSGVVSSTNSTNFVKQGVGTLVLANSGNTFGGAGTLIDVQGGILQVNGNSDAVFGNSANAIVLNTNSATQGLRVTGSFSSARNFVLNQATNDIEVTQGITGVGSFNPASYSTFNTFAISTPFVLGAASNNLTKADAGVLVLSASNSAWSGTIAINGGALQVTGSNASILGSGAITVANVTGAALQLNNGASIANVINLNAAGINTSGSLQSISGTNSVTGNIVLGSNSAIGVDAGTLNLTNAGTLTGTFNLTLAGAGTGNMNRPIATSTGTLTKIGSGQWNLTAANTLTGNIAVNAGTLGLSGAAGSMTGTATITVQNGGAFVIDDTGTHLANRIGTGIRPLALNGGAFTIKGNTGVATVETNSTGTLTLGGGLSTITLDATGNTVGGLQFNVGTLAVPATGATALLRGTSLGSALGAGVANFVVTTPNLIGGAGAAGTITMSIRPDIIGDVSPTGTGTGFVTSVASTGFRLLNTSTELSSSVAQATATTNMAFSTSQAVNGPASMGSLTLNTGGGITGAKNAVLSLGAAGGAGILALDTTTGNTISGSIIAPAGPLFVHAVGNLTLSGGSAITGTASVTKSEAGSLNFSGSQYYSGTTTINGGTLQLASGTTNTLLANSAMVVNNGGTLDLNGGTQYVAGLTSTGAAVNSGIAGGVIKSTPGTGTIITNAAAQVFAGSIQGANVNFVRSGASGLMTLTSAQTYGGATLINGGGLTSVNAGANNGNSLLGLQLTDNGALTNTSSIAINYSSLNISNTSTTLTDSTARVNPSAPITLNGGVLSFFGRASSLSSQSVGAVTANQGVSFISAAEQSNFTSPVDGGALTLLSFGRTASAGATVQFVQDYQNNSAARLGVLGAQNKNIFITGGVPLTNNIIGGWATVMNGFFATDLAEFATYNSTQGVGALNAAGYAQYDGTSLVANQPAQNIRLAGTALTVTSGGSTVNTLNLANGTTTAVAMTFANNGDILNLTSGGLIVQNVVASAAATTIGVAGGNLGKITAGGSTPGANSDLYLYYYANGGAALTMNSVIADNLNGTGTNASGIDSSVRLVVSGGNWGTANVGNVILASTNTYTGGSVINGETLTIGATGTLPGNGLTINNGVVTQTLGGVLTSQAVTLNGSATLNVNQASTPQSLTSITFNNSGGITNPAVAIATGTTLQLPGGGNLITVNSANVGTTATISAAGTGTLDFAGGTPTITVNPIMVTGTVTANGTYTGGTNVAPWQASLNISAPISNSGLITLMGGGVTQLSGASTFTGGVNLSNGGLVIGASSTPSTVGSTVTSGPLGTGSLTIGAGTTVLSSASANTVANAVNVSGNFAFGGVNNLALNGTVTLPGAATTIEVTAPQMNATLGAAIPASAAGIVKAGLGTLTLANNNAFTGNVTINGGTLVGNGVNGAVITPFGTGTAINLNGGTLGIRNNGSTNYAQIYVGSSSAPQNLIVGPSATGVTVDINNNGANTGNTIVLGDLSMASSTQLNVTGGNSYSLKFTSQSVTGSTLTNFNPGSGLTIILPGGFTDANRPTNVGTGTLLLGGTNSFTTGTTITASNSGATPTTGTANVVYGAGQSVTFNGTGINYTLLPQTGALAITGASTGLQQSFTNVTPTGLLNASLWGNAPTSAFNGVQPNDVAVDRVQYANPNSGLVVYSGYLNIATGGTYSFIIGSDDASALVIDGVEIAKDPSGGHGVQDTARGSIVLAPGQHSITLKVNVGTGQAGGGSRLLYSGPDTSLAAGNNGYQAIPSSALSSFSGPANAGNNYYNAAQVDNDYILSAGSTVTLQGLGSDYNSTVKSLTFAGAGTLSATNDLGTSAVGGTGFIGVKGLTTISSVGAVVNPTSANLYLIGGVSDGGNGLTKTGSGTLSLNNSSAFSGAFAINAGTVRIFEANALSTGSNTVASGASLDLNGVASSAGRNVTVNGTGSTSQPGALYNSAATAASLAGNLTLASASTIAGYGDITLTGTVTASTLLTKALPDNLTLVANNAATMTGGLAITAGVVNNGTLNSGVTGALGGGTVTLSAGAVLNLNGNSTDRAITTNGTSITNQGPNQTTLGNIINSSLPTSFAVASPASPGFAQIKQTNTATTSTITGNITMSTATLGIGSNTFATGGDIVVSGVISGAFALTKVGGDALFLRGANTFSGGLIVNFGSVILDNGGILNGAGGALTVQAGGSLVLDNTGTLIQNRINNSVAANNKNLVLNAGTFTINGNSSATALNETITTATPNTTAILINQGQNYINLVDNAAASSGGITVTATKTGNGFDLTNANGGTVLITAKNLGINNPGTADSTNIVLGSGSSTAALAMIGQNSNTAGGGSALNKGIAPFAIVDDGANVNFAVFDSAAKGIRALGSVTGEYTATNTNALVTNDNTLINAATAVAVNATISINSLKMTGNTLALQQGTSMNIQSGGILATADASITGPGIISVDGTPAASSTGNSQNVYIHTYGATTNLTLGASLGYAFNNSGRLGSVFKAGSGNLILSGANFYTTNTLINEGTLTLNNDQAIFYRQTAPASVSNFNSSNTGPTFQVNYGATVNLNGFDLTLDNLNSMNPAGTAQGSISGGTIINNVAGTKNLTIDTTTNNTWSGNISNGTGVINFSHYGRDTFTVTNENTYTGTTVIGGGVTTLVDAGAFRGTSGVTINAATLIWNDNGGSGDAYRLGAVPASFVFNGGGFQFNGRQGAFSVANLGAVTLASGANQFSTTAGLYGSATTMMTSFTRNAGAVVNFAGSVLGDDGNVKVSGTAPTNYNGILGGWAITNTSNPYLGFVGSTTIGGGSFVEYDPATGFRAIVDFKTTGVIDYQSGTDRPAFGNAAFGLNSNVRVNSNTTLLAGNNVANSMVIGINASTVLTFAAPTDTLFVQSGGILGTADNNTKDIGASVAGGGKITAGNSDGSAGAGNATYDLYLHNLSNTLTVNAQIVNNGANAVNLITSTGAQNGPVIRLANTNTYTGSTIINSTDLRLASTVGASIANSLNISVVGGTENAADSSRQAMTRILFENAGNQLNAGATVTIVNNATLDTNNFDQTLANIVFNNTGGHTGNSSGVGGSVRSGIGTITLTGNVTATNLTNTSTIPFIQGNLNLNGGQRTITVDPITGAGVLGAAQIGLSIFAEMTNGGINKEGTGVLAITGINNYTGATNVNAGTLVLGGRDQQGTPAALTAQLAGSRLNVGINGTVDMRGGNAFVGSLSGSGLVTNSVYATTTVSAGNPGTLFIGFDNTTDANFSGLFTNFINGINETTGYALNITKQGSGTQTFSGDNAVPIPSASSNGDTNNAGTLDIQQGGVVVSGANGSLGFTTINIKNGASLTVDDSTNNKANRLGGYRVTDTANGDIANDTTTARTINMQGGTLVFKEGTSLINEGTSAALALGTNSGAPTVVLNNGTSTWLFDTTGGAAGATINVGAMTAGSGSLFINVGGSQTLGRVAAGANSINIYVNGGKTGQGSGSLSAPGTAVASVAGVQGNIVGGIRPDITAQDSTGTGFVTYDTFGYRLLQTNEYSAFPVQPDSPLTTGATTNATNPAANWAAPAPTVGASYTGNAWLSSLLAFNTNTTILSLRLDNGGGLRSAGGSVPLARSSGQTFNALGTLNTVTVSSGSIIGNTGNTGITGGAVSSGAAALRITAAGDMNVSSYLISTATATALVKEGTGTLTLNKPVLLGSSTDPGQTVVNGGQLNLSSGPNTLTVINTGVASLADTLTVNSGGTVDLTGNDQVIGNLISADTSAGGGGLVTNSGAAANLFLSQPNNSFVTYGGAIGGAINLYKTSVSGANPSNLTLTAPSTYTGSTTVQGGVLILQDSATLASTTYNLNGGRVQSENRTGSLSGIANRIPTSSVLNMRTGVYLELGRPGQDVFDTVSTVNSLQGYNELRVDSAASAAASLNVAALNVTSGSQVFFNTGFGTLGNAGANPTISFDNFDASSMTINGVIPWAVMDATSDANTAAIVMYNSTINPLTGKAYGVSVPNTTAGGFTTANYQATALASAVSGQNLNQSGTGTVAEAATVTTRTFNSLRFSQSTATTLALAPTELMRIEAGVIISAQQALTISNGKVTAGVITDTPVNFYVNPTNQSLTFNSQIVDNGTGALTLVKGGGNTLTLTPSLAAGGSQTGAASNATLAGSTTLTLSAAVATPPAVGQKVYGPGIANGTTVAAVSGSTITLSAPALATTSGGTFGFGDAQVLTGTNASVASGAVGAITITVTPAQASNLYIGATVGGTGIPSGVTIASINTGTGAVTTTSFTASAAIAANQAFAYSSAQINTNESYSGGTVVNSTGTMNLSAGAGNRVINSGPLTINNGGIVTMINAGQIAPTTDLTINGGGTLTYAASANAATGLNALNSITFNDNGGTVQPKVDIVAAGILTVTGGMINSANDNQGSTPLITNGTLTFGQISLATTTTGSANVTVSDVSGWVTGQTVVGDNIPAGTTISSISGNTLTLSTTVPTGATGAISTVNQAPGSTGTMTPTLNVTTTTPNKLTADLQIASVIANSTVGGAGIGGWSNLANGGAPLTKIGNGNLALSGANTFDNGFSLNEGTVTVGNNAAFGTGPLTIMGGTTIMADSTTRTITNSMIIKGDFTFGGQQAGNNLTQGTGTVDLNGGTRNITVTNPTVTATIGGVISNGGLTKSGNGILTLTGANTYAGGTVINAGLVTAGNATALGANTNDLTVKAGATLSMSNVSVTVDGLNGDDSTHGGLITSTGAAAQTLTIGNNNETSATFAGTITNGAQALNIIKTGTGTQVLNGTNTYTGTTTVSGGVLQVGDNTTGTDATLGSGAVTVNNGGTLAGTGHVLAPSTGNTMTIANGGVLAPGDSAGAANGNLTLGSITGNGLAPLSVTTAASSPGTVTGAVNLAVASGGQVRLGITTPTLNSGDLLAQFANGTFVNAATTFAGLAVADKQRWDGQMLTQLATSKVGVADITLASLGLGDTVGGSGNGGLYVGQSVTGAGIANGTTIVAINTATKTVTLSQAVSATPTALTIGGTVQNVTVVAGLNSITVADTTGLSVGDSVSGYGIAPNSVIASISVKVITLKDATTGVASVPLASTYAPTLSFGTSGSYDHLSIAGTLTLGTNVNGTVKVLDNGYIANAALGDVFNLLDWSTILTSGTFSAGTNFRVGGTGGGDLDLPVLTTADQLWDISAFTTRGIIAVVPEPGRAMLLAFGLLSLGMRRRRR